MILLADTDPILRQKAVALDKVTPEVISLVYDMKRLCKENNGLAIAAPQVGHSIRLICLDIPGTPSVMINPVIMQSKNFCIMEEGCLTFPDKFRKIKRSELIKVKWRDLNYKLHFGEFYGVAARAIIHECDHLNGKLFIDLEEAIEV